MVLLDTLWPRSGLPARDDYTRVEGWKTEACNMLEGYTFEEVANVCRDIARTSEWLPKFSAILKGLRSKDGEVRSKGRYYQYIEWVSGPEGYEPVRSYIVTKTAPGKVLLPKAIGKKATKEELTKQRIFEADDLIALAREGKLTLEEFETIRGKDGKPVDGRWRLDHYVYQPERVLAVLKGQPPGEAKPADRAGVQQRLFEALPSQFKRADDIVFGEEIDFE